MSTKTKQPAKKAADKEVGTLEHEIELSNSGPLERFSFKTHPGWNFVLGENDTGKTQGVMPAVLIISGDDKADFVLRRGASEGSIKLDGKPVMIPKRANKNGDVELQVLNHSPIAGVISPGYGDEKVNERHRLEEFLKLAPVAVTADSLAMLFDTQNPEELEDLQAAIDNVKDELIAANIEELSKPEKNIVDVKEWLRLQLNKWALDYEKSADQAQGEINAHTRERPEKLIEVSVEDADAAYREAVGHERETKGSAEQRAQREQERKRIAETLPEQRPAVEEAESREQLAMQAHDLLVDEIEELERQLEIKREAIKARAEAVDGAMEETIRLRKAATDWDKQKLILNSEITGATSEDVETAFRGVLAARETLEAARTANEYRQAVLAREKAQAAREASLKYAALYRKLAQGLTGALSAVLDEAGVPGVGVNAKGYLCAKKRNGQVETFQSLNFERRFDVAVDAWAAGTDLDGMIIAIPTAFFAELDPTNRAAAEKKWIEHNIHAVVAIPAAGGLRVEQSVKMEGGQVAQ